jgi:hypothetical protein
MDMGQLQTQLAARKIEIETLVPSLSSAGTLPSTNALLNGNIIGGLTTSLQPSLQFNQYGAK